MLFKRRKKKKACNIYPNPVNNFIFILLLFNPFINYNEFYYAFLVRLSLIARDY